MKIGIMQPYFFPYIGYYQLLAQADQWVVFDQIQFIDKGWVNRNRVLHPEEAKGWQYITLPLKNRGQFDRICDIEINNNIHWREQILGKLTCYKKKAPYYIQVIDFVKYCFEMNDSNLGRFVSSSIKKTAEVLGVNTKIDIQSEMNLHLGEIANPGQWALRIAQAVGASEYINPPGGYEIFNEDEYTNANIKLTFIKSNLTEYAQRRNDFIKGLSIIDVMMWNSPEQIKNMLMSDFQLLTKTELNALHLAP